MNLDEVISGLNGVALDEFINGLGEAEKVEVIKQLRRSNKMNLNVSSQGTSRNEFAKRINLLEPSLQKDVIAGKKRFADIAYYAVKSISQTNSVKLLRDDDFKVVGVGNLSKGSLEKENVLMLDTIILLYGVNTSVTDAGDVDFDLLPKEVRNGEFIFKANGTEIIPLTSCEVFDTENMNIKKGSFKLANPVMVHTQKAMEFEVFWKTTSVQYSWLKAILVGTTLYKK